MNYKTSSSLVNGKIDELKSQIAFTKTNDAISKNTRGTKLYALSRERRVLCLINELMSHIDGEFELSDNAQKTFVLLTTLAGERTVGTRIEVHEGDSVLELIKKYHDVKNIMNKIETAAQKSGLRIDYAVGKIVK